MLFLMNQDINAIIQGIKIVATKGQMVNIDEPVDSIISNLNDCGVKYEIIGRDDVRAASEMKADKDRIHSIEKEIEETRKQIIIIERKKRGKKTA